MSKNTMYLGGDGGAAGAAAAGGGASSQAARSSAAAQMANKDLIKSLPSSSRDMPRRWRVCAHFSLGTNARFRRKERRAIAPVIVLGSILFLLP
jgi:hypothetical protein